jgi:hypothetical protein
MMKETELLILKNEFHEKKISIPTLSNYPSVIYS